MNEKELLSLKETIIMPSETEAALLQSCAKTRRKHFRYSRYSAVCAALTALLCIAAIGSTSYATYNAYQEKQLAIFMEPDMTTEEKAALGEQLAQMPELSDCHYISGSVAWEDFRARFLTGDEEIEKLADAFADNPLKDSDNYRVSVRFTANTEEVRAKIEALAGVRKIQTIQELYDVKEEYPDGTVRLWITDKEDPDAVINYITDTENPGAVIPYILEQKDASNPTE